MTLENMKKHSYHKNPLFKDYHQYWSFSTRKKGYSGCSIFSKIKPVSYELKFDKYWDEEGRYVQLEFEDFYIVSVYVPNSGHKLVRLGPRT